MERITILEVIPIEELPFNSPDFFLYFTTNNIKKGSIVKISLKNKETFGYVYNVRSSESYKSTLKNLEFQLKPINNIYINNSFISSIQEKFALWISKNYCLSLPHSFYLFLNFFKKIDKESIENIEIKEELGKRFQKKFVKEIDYESLKKLPALIILPTEDHANIIYEKLKYKFKDKVLLLDFEAKRTQFNEIIKSILKKEEKIYIGSKNSIFFPWQKLNQIIVLEEGHIFYKEFFKIPYFNYLNLIEVLGKLLKTEFIISDKLPSLKTVIEFSLEKQIDINLNVKKFETIFEIEKILETYKKVKIFAPIKVLSKKLRCNVCFYEFNCPKCNFPLSIYENEAFCRICFKKYQYENRCPKCNSNDIYIKGIGALWLKRFLEKRGYFVWLLKNKRDIKEFNSHNFEKFILIGSYNILNPSLPKTEAGIFINFDQANISWSPFLKERFLRIIYELSKSSSDLYLHTNQKIEELEKIRNLSILEEILKERAINKLPPYYRLIKLVSRFKSLETLNKRLIDVKEKINKNLLNYKKYVEVSGPFLERIPLKKRRYQMFLLLKIRGDINLKKILENISFIEEIKADEEDF